MTVDKEFFNVKYKEGSLDPKTAQLVFLRRLYRHRPRGRRQRCI